MINELTKAFFETCYMVLAAGLLTWLIGLPLGILLALTNNKILNLIINATRSIPFIILMIALIPITRFIVGSSITLNAVIIPLSVATIPFYARIVENALSEVPKGLIEAAKAMGASPLQIIRKVYLPESHHSRMNGLTLTLVNLVGYSAMAGFNGSGGLGKLAIDYGFYRYDTQMVLATVLIMIGLVQLIQSIGDYCVRQIKHR